MSLLLTMLVFGLQPEAISPVPVGCDGCDAVKTATSLGDDIEVDMNPHVTAENGTCSGMESPCNVLQACKFRRIIYITNNRATSIWVETPTGWVEIGPVLRLTTFGAFLRESPSPPTP